MEKKLHDLPQKDTGCLEKLLLLFLFLPIQTLASRTSEKLTIAFEKMRAATASMYAAGAASAQWWYLTDFCPVKSLH